MNQATEISKIHGIDQNLSGVDEDGIPRNAVKKYAKINPSGWLCYSLGVIDHEAPESLPIHIELTIELGEDSNNGAKFNEEFLAYPYKAGTTEEDVGKPPVAWSLLQPRTGLGVMPIAPEKMTGGDYLIAGRFSGFNTVSTVAIKDKISVHSQGALLLHVVFSTNTPRTIYFKINNQCAPFVKILFYSFQIQSFYNGVLKYFYAPLYKNVVFKESSFDAKGLFIQRPPTPGAVKKLPIENIYQFSKRDVLGDAALRFSEAGDELYIEEGQNFYCIDGCNAQKNTDSIVNVLRGPKDCDFRYFSDSTVFPTVGTMPLLKSLNRDFFTTPQPLNEASEKNIPAFIRDNKEYNVGPSLDSAQIVVEKDHIFEVIDKDSLPITPVVDMSSDYTKGNITKIAITLNSNIIFVVGSEFMRKITEGRYASFDIIFNKKQYWIKFVFPKGLNISAEDEGKLKSLFPQFGSLTVPSQKIISDGIDEITRKIGGSNMSMTFKPLVKIIQVDYNGQSKWILDPADRNLSLAPRTFAMNADRVTTQEFAIETLSKELVEKINKTIKVPLEVPVQ